MTGGLLFSVVISSLSGRRDFANHTNLIIAGCLLAAGTISIATLWTARSRQDVRPIVLWSAFKRPAYSALCSGLLFIYAGYYIPFFWIGSYAVARDVAPAVAKNLLPIMIVAVLPGLFLIRSIVGPCRPLIVLSISTVLMAVVGACWVFAETGGYCIFIAALYGILSGTFISVLNQSITSLDSGFSATETGTAHAFAAFGILLGNPVAANISDISSGNYRPAQLLCGGLLLIGAAFVLCAEEIQRYQILRTRHESSILADHEAMHHHLLRPTGRDPLASGGVGPAGFPRGDERDAISIISSVDEDRPSGQV